MIGSNVVTMVALEILSLASHRWLEVGSTHLRREYLKYPPP